MEGSRNRKQRRAAAAANSKTGASFDPSSIPLAHPARDASISNGKTLVELIAERQNEILSNGEDFNESGGATKPGLATQFVSVDPASGKISQFDPSTLSEEQKNDDSSTDDEPASEDHQPDTTTEDPIPPLIDTLLLSVPLTTLHLTLAYLAAYQYAEKVELDKLLRESAFIALPMLTLLIHLAHGHILSIYTTGPDEERISLFPWSQDKLSLSFLRKLVFPPTLRTSAFLSVAVLLGCKLITSTNEDPYYAVMKRAPAIGTLWVWSILEIPAGAAILGALGPLVWGVWWKGYGIL
ncbi:uncharacterized protein ACLA_015560 [Aspergillus clavatus NRRL 1]|uniref:DUF7719 domain-containing protein n=1 Tax=Aspergillus clavatus (strain ATCC 1007 / CBS 513.65 / DSM 816 / NCTC 3887 / NRRL 1 / QM 1276 / 107) TaxID=344612 RepID=A1CBJ6_ASPCL|nr:uncharacterized protein ACLA_015560 [Aspergillus clavatus NRRL 1]EAW13114.1 conserved hypothetical protein [Aspergillus clavatus NRRL 1]